MKIKFHKSLGSLEINLEVEGTAEECASVLREIASNVVPGDMDGIRREDDAIDRFHALSPRQRATF